MSKVSLLDFWVSPFGMRARIALAEKGVEFERQEEDLFGGKSDLLLSSNPVYKKVPVLLHDAKPVCESLIILNYIDDAWPEKPLLPQCPYERAQARFWADFTDKIFETGSNVWRSKGQAQEEAKKEFIDSIKLLEGALGEKKYFGGETFGFADIATIAIASWFYAYETCGGFKLADECPKFAAWMKRCGERESVSTVLPEPSKVYEFVCMMKKMHGLE
ncbi:probable glutathione S-transferase [Amborella trichopoda]|uniref:probable glutathione S-transferase n=1 Tax=Amborella trichopoda TaxID=13333 RepID=UPI0005D380E2|nr:probable glutathione S-transferase [Amborella trichopoda]|eukprot:XP_006855601.2 probable glutathione S-transferase [Amborella trichopoda]